MTAKMFDAIVVGTGAGGGTAMKLLCEAGPTVAGVRNARGVPSCPEPWIPAVRERRR